MSESHGDTARILTSYTLEHGTKADWIDCFNELGNKGFICSLTNFKVLFLATPDVASCFTLRARACDCWGDKGRGMGYQAWPKGWTEEG